MSLNDSIFEAMGEFALTVELLVKAGWSFRLEPGDRYVSPVLHVMKGKRDERCHDDGDVRRLIPVSEGVFGETWDSLPNPEAYRGYDEGFRNCKEGWMSDFSYATPDYRAGYCLGWEDAKSLGLFPQR